MTLYDRLLRVAHDKASTRRHLVPLLREAGTLRLAHRPHLTDMGLDARKVQKGEAFALYYIDAANNNSKFYEGLMLPNGDGSFRVLFRWGALTDSGFTGRIDGSKFDGRQSMLDERSAKGLMMKKYRAKTGKGYVDAWKHKGAKGQYPVGLTRDVGFGWGTQEAAFCTPALREVQMLLKDAQGALDQQDWSRAVQLQDEAASTLRSDRGSSMLKKVNDNLKHLQGRAERVLADPASNEVRNWRTAMSRLISYLDKQLSECHGKTAAAKDEQLRRAILAKFHEVPTLRAAVLPAMKEAKGKAKLKGKKLDKFINSTYSRLGNRITINMMDIPKIWNASKSAYEGAASHEEAVTAMESAMKAAIQKAKV